MFIIIPVNDNVEIPRIVLSLQSNIIISGATDKWGYQKTICSSKMGKF